MHENKPYLIRNITPDEVERIAAQWASITLNAILLSFILSCGTSKKERLIVHENYEVSLAKKQVSVLILFPCYPCDVEHTKREAFFLNGINGQGVTTILLKFRLFWLRKISFSIFPITRSTKSGFIPNLLLNGIKKTEIEHIETRIVG